MNLGMIEGRSGFYILSVLQTIRDKSESKKFVFGRRYLLNWSRYCGFGWSSASCPGSNPNLLILATLSWTQPQFDRFRYYSPILLQVLEVTAKTFGFDSRRKSDNSPTQYQNQLEQRYEGVFWQNLHAHLIKSVF